ncbi:unnamed protein product, partial [Prorocentrum cordatum]
DQSKRHEHTHGSLEVRGMFPCCMGTRAEASQPSFSTFCLRHALVIFTCARCTRRRPNHLGPRRAAAGGWPGQHEVCMPSLQARLWLQARLSLALAGWARLGRPRAPGHIAMCFLPVKRSLILWFDLLVSSPVDSV